jgi:hypothetical protein
VDGWKSEEVDVSKNGGISAYDDKFDVYNHDTLDYCTPVKASASADQLT